MKDKKKFWNVVCWTLTGFIWVYFIWKCFFYKGGGNVQWTLEAMRINKGLTQAELAEKFEVSSQTIARLEKDSSDIGYQLLKKYMFFFNVKFDDIFLGKKYENFVNN